MDLSGIIASSRSKADEQATGFIDDVEATRFINQGLRFVYGKIVQRFEYFFVVKGTTGNGGLISVTANLGEYNLPSTMLKLLRVERRNTNDTNENNWCKMTRLNLSSDNHDYFYPNREGRDYGFGYYIAGSKLYLRPVPSGGFDARLWFVPQAVELVDPTDVPVIPEEYHELLSEYASIQMLRKSGEGIWKEASEIFNQELQNMLDTVEYRSQEPEQMVISDDNDFGWWNGMV